MSSGNVFRCAPDFVPARWRAFLVVGVAGLVVLGCGGPAAQTGHSPSTTPIQVKDPLPDIPEDQTEFTARFYTPGGQFTVEKLEMEFYGGRRGRHYFFGFFRDQYDQPQQIEFRELSRVDFIDQMNQSLYEQAILGREELGLSINNAFQLRLHYWDGNQQEFFAFIPKLRGEKDFQSWEFPMDSNVRQILYLEFER